MADLEISPQSTVGGPEERTDCSSMGSLAAPFLCLSGLLGILGHATHMPESTPPNGTTTYLKPNERFRRLIPYMTFYFAQQSYDNQPHFQQYIPAPIYIRSNKVAMNMPVPQYQGNLEVPTTYLLQPNHINTKSLVQPTPAHQAAPKQQYTTIHSGHRASSQLYPFTVHEAINYNTLQNNGASHTNPPLQTYNTPSINTYTNPSIASHPVKIPALSAEARTNALIRILSILQQTQTLPQKTITNNNVQMLAQVLSILQQTNQMSNDTKSKLAKLLSDLPLTSKTVSGTNNGGSVKINQINVKVSPEQSLDAVHNAEKSPGQIVYNNQYTAKLPSITTTTLEQPQKIVDLQSFNIVTKLQSTSLPIISDVSSGYVVIPSSTTHTPIADQSNDVQGDDYTIKVLSNVVSTTKPLEYTTSSPALTDNMDGLRPYGYAKQPQPFYQGPTTSQSFPDPHTEGSTPGKAGIDYPVYDTIPPTSFTCKSQRYKGFFGDPETSCQVWHYCDLNGGQASFLCPNGTIFSQVALTCDWWFNVRCESTHQLYVLNERLYKYILPVMPSFPEDFSGPVVDKYLTIKFQEQEEKKNNKSMITEETSKNKR